MSQPAARLALDTAGHVGPILLGSPNVLIGGAPAARKGDTFICADPTHGGSGTIVGGSGTVYINGVPAARMGDTTSCPVIPLPPPVVSGGAADILYSSTFAGTNKDGILKDILPDKLDVKFLHGERGFQDKTGDGSYDYVHAGGKVFSASLEEVNTTVLGLDIAGSGNYEYITGEAGAGLYDSNGHYGYEGHASVAAAKGDLTHSYGDPDIFQLEGKASGEALSAEARANSELFLGGDKNRWGFSGGAALGAEAIKGDLTASTTNALFDLSATGGASALSAGGGGDVLGYVDLDERVIRAEIGGELAVALGLKVGINVTLKWGVIVDFFSPPLPAVFPGIVISGTPQVLIGG